MKFTFYYLLSSSPKLSTTFKSLQMDISNISWLQALRRLPGHPSNLAMMCNQQPLSHRFYSNEKSSGNDEVHLILVHLGSQHKLTSEDFCLSGKGSLHPKHRCLPQMQNLVSLPHWYSTDGSVKANNSSSHCSSGHCPSLSSSNQVGIGGWSSGFGRLWGKMVS